MSAIVDAAPFVAGALGAGGIGVWVSRRRELVRRWCTWALIAPVVGGALYFGAAGAALLAAALGIVAAAEYGRLFGLSAAQKAVVAAAAAGLPLAAWLAPGGMWRLAAAAVLAAAIVPVLAGDTEGGARRAAAGVFGVAWLGGLSGLVLLGEHAFALCVAVAVADVGAWCGGRFLGGPPLSPLSPAKRWGGVLGGAIAGTAALALLGAFTPGLVIAVAVAVPLGDLLESMLKRGAGVKDTGTWLPGFGGLLDRLDSLLLALPVAMVLS
ncbi:phosphatidate cytidylyltransferase [Murinocardiopsis flavida]|uniref:Phosphatidate cytidylyltransferase n=1 Tax=Murinocardiopsis flavida TaxID=645275 RepID=A0A2P8CPL0_9ACTN|nr:phosphatidate cytidylyltransferase [Murinocardiopsis flavida]PSK86908.1 phosphatidate cytidylyltransferase [Murinocardiopsis flavida]